MSKSCTTLVRFGAVTLDKRLHIFVLLWNKIAKWAYLANYLRTRLTNLDKLFGLIDKWVGIINLTFALRSLKGRCYGNQLIWDTLQTSNWPHKYINTDNDAATSCKNLVNISAVTPEITFLLCVPLCVYWAKIGLRSPFVALAFPDALDDWSVDGRV